MRYTALLLAFVTCIQAKAAGTLFANDLALQCSSTEREKRLTCEAGIVTRRWTA